MAAFFSFLMKIIFIYDSIFHLLLGPEKRIGNISGKEKDFEISSPSTA